MKSIDPGDYAAQPEREAPAGYICVIRDVESDRWRIEGARQPKALVEGILAESESRFGIEIVSLLETEDLAASASQLYERHHAELGETWLRLDDYQLETLRRSALRIDSQPSHYLTPNTPAATAKTTTAPSRGNALRRSARQRRDRWGLQRDGAARQPLFRLYGAKSLKDYQEPEPRDPADYLYGSERILHEAFKRFAKFRESYAGKALQVVLFLLFVAMMCVTDGCS